MKNRNDIIIKLYNEGYSTQKISSIFDISIERITQILSNDNKDLRNKSKGKLSPKEKLITELIAEGLTDKEIGYKLKISPRTVQTHVARIVIKLEAINRTNAVYIAVLKNYIAS